MKYAIRYFTQSGNTKKLADAIGNALSLEAENLDAPLSEKVEVLFLGCSYYAFDMDPHVKTFLQENKNQIGQVVLFGTSCMMKSMKKPMKKVLDPLNIALSENEFHCHGSFGPLHKGKPDEADLKAVRDFALRLAK